MDSTNKNSAFKPFRAQSEFEDWVAKGDVLSGAFLFSALPDVQERNPVGVSIWSDLDRVATRHDVPASYWNDSQNISTKNFNECTE